MSSSNLVRIAFIPESVYGVTPGAGNFLTARFTSDSLSGSPETTESQQIRTDRMSSGQVVTGLTVGGDINFELAKEAALESFMESALFNTWVVDTPVAVDITVDTAAKTLTRASGTWANDTAIGDVVVLDGFADSANNVPVIILSFTSATVAKYAGIDTMVDETGSGTSFQVADKLSIGSTKKSFSMEKAFTDLTTKAINYKGMIVSAFNLNVTYGEIITGSFSFSGNDYSTADSAGEFLTNGRTITAAATTNSFNGSVDMPFLVTSAIGDFDEAAFCIQSIEISLNNNLNAQTCIGQAAPKDYSPGTAQIGVNLSAYLSNDSWSILAKKLSQESFGVGFIVKNNDGYYGAYLPAIQVSFDDPASAGQNQDVILNMSGVAKVGPNGVSALTLFKTPA